MGQVGDRRRDFGEKELVTDASVWRNEVVARPRDAVHHVVFGNVRVEDAERADDLAALIRQKRVGNLIRLAEGPEGVLPVIRDGGDMNALRAKVRQRHIQLDQLIATVRSPVRAAAEHEQQPARTREVLQRVPVPVLIGQRELWHPVSDGRTCAVPVILSLNELTPIGRGDLVATTGQASDHITENDGLFLYIHVGDVLAFTPPSPIRAVTS